MSLRANVLSKFLCNFFRSCVQNKMLMKKQMNCKYTVVFSDSNTTETFVSLNDNIVQGGIKK